MPRLSGGGELADESVGLRKLTDFARSRGWVPAGAIAETVPRHAVAVSTLTVTSGTLKLAGGIVLPGGQGVTSITVFSGSTALSVGSNQWFALFDSSRNKLAVTSDDTNTAWAANTAKTLNLSATYTPASDIEVYVGLLVVATTPPSLCSPTMPTPMRTIGGDSSTGLTNPASCPATAGAITGTNPFYAYVS